MGARPAVAVIENLVAGRRQQDFLRSRLVVASARAIRAPPSETARRRRITSSIALSVGRNEGSVLSGVRPDIFWGDIRLRFGVSTLQQERKGKKKEKENIKRKRNKTSKRKKKMEKPPEKGMA